MSSVIEMLANKKKPAVAPVPAAEVLPMLHKEHEGECGESCGCGENEGGCCGG